MYEPSHFSFSYHAVDGRRFVSAHIDHVERAMGSVRAVFPPALFSGICSPFIILFFDLFNSLGYSRLNLQLEIGKRFICLRVSLCFILRAFCG